MIKLGMNKNWSDDEIKVLLKKTSDRKFEKIIGDLLTYPDNINDSGYDSDLAEVVM